METTMTERKNLGLDFEVKEIGEEGTFRGFGSVFNNVDFWNDIVLPGAFEKSIARKTPAMLWQHNSDEPIGVYTKVEERPKGLYVEGKLLIDGVARARELHALLTAGAVRGMSIGYHPVAWEYQERNKERVRLLKEIDLWEISLVTFPANEKALVQDVKSMEEHLDPEILVKANRILEMMKG